MDIGNHQWDGWLAAAASVPGRSHIRAGIPCQDASLAGIAPRPHVVVCDGRGSARHSEIGASASVAALRSQLDNASGLFATVLDGDDGEEARKAEPMLSTLLYRTAAQEQRRQAEASGTVAADFEHTLLVVVCGRRRFLCIQVGDGGIAMRRTDGLAEMLSLPARGEFANTTSFVSCGRPTPWRHFLGDMNGASGFMAFSDGTAEKLVSTADNAAAPAIGQIIGRAASGEFGREAIVGFLTEPHWEPQVQDDRSLAVVATVKSARTESAADSVVAEESGNREEENAFAKLWRRHRDEILVAIAALLTPLLALWALGS